MFAMNADRYFHIGKTHLSGGGPCQDHALASVADPAGFAVVSDGCSTGRHTDMGARIATFAAVVAFMRFRNDADRLPAKIGSLHRTRMRNAKSAFGLRTEDLLATSVSAFLSPEGGFFHVAGDGVVARKARDGRLTLSRFDWDGNMPFYGAYALSGGREEEFVHAQGGDLSAPRLTEERWVHDDAEGFAELPGVTHSLAEGISGITRRLSPETVVETAFAAVFTDGVTQIDGVDWKDAVRAFMAFKNTKGEFAKRRMIRGLGEFGRSGRGPLDDIAVAVIRPEWTEEACHDDD